jgi:release factor glutamine methyltransferase
MKSTPRETWTIVQMLRWTIDYFRAKGVSEPRASAEVLLAHVLQVSRLELYLRYDQPLTPEELARFKALMLRRRDGEPVAYLTGQREFWSLNFRVTPAVLIPRPETEVLVQAALEAAKEIMELGGEGQGPPTGETPVPLAPASSPKPPPPTPDVKILGAGLKPAPTKEADQPPPEWECEELPPFSESQPKTENRKLKTGPPWGLEVGVGSGAVVVALARELPALRWLALDLAAAALSVARDNARRHGVAARIEFLRADRLTPLKPGSSFNLVVANLPYVSRADWERLPKDIKDYEPQEALLAGEDGLALIRPLAQQAHQYLQDGGWLALEVGEGQAPPVLELLQETGAYDRVEALADYQGIPRVVRARRRFSD